MRRRILIVEDDPVLTRVLRDNLVLDGFEVEAVADGGLAAGAAGRFAPDLVLLDLTLPERSGFDLIGELRQGGRTPVLILTARPQKADRLRAIALGATQYLTKPFDLDDLLSRVRAALD